MSAEKSLTGFISEGSRLMVVVAQALPDGHPLEDEAMAWVQRAELVLGAVRDVEGRLESYYHSADGTYERERRFRIAVRDLLTGRFFRPPNPGASRED